MGNNFVIKPLGQHFELPEIRAHLDAQPDVLEAPQEKNSYLILGHPAMTSLAMAACVDTPDRLPLGAAAFPSPEQIIVHQEYADAAEERSALEFLRWLSSKYHFSIRVDGFQDLTDKVREHGIDSLYDEGVRVRPLAWAGELLQIGFFEDHLDGRGGVAGYRLKDCISETPQEHEAEILAYLRAGHLYRRFEGELFDVLDTSQDMEIEPALFTDGCGSSAAEESRPISRS
jgi:hypothetical protein